MVGVISRLLSCFSTSFLTVSAVASSEALLDKRSIMIVKLIMRKIEQNLGTLFYSAV